MSLVLLVEGHSEAESVPILLRRLMPEFPVARPFRIKRNKIIQPGEIERAVRLAIADREHASCVIVLIDADDDCPAQLGPELVERCKTATNLPVAVVLANREIESWFLGGIESLRGLRGIGSDAEWTSDPEAPRDAKGRVEEQMKNRSYVSVADQPALMMALDFQTARKRCPSLDKFIRDVERLIQEVGAGYEDD